MRLTKNMALGLGIVGVASAVLAYKASQPAPQPQPAPGPLPGPAPGPGPTPNPALEFLQAEFRQLVAAADANDPNVDPDRLDLVANQLQAAGLTAEAATLHTKAAEVRAKRGIPTALIRQPHGVAR